MKRGRQQARPPRAAAKDRAVVTLTIEKAIYGGAGLAHVAAEDAVRAGKTIFVPMTLPGEVVEAELLAEKKQFANARLLRVMQPAAGRITARCKHYGVCGGCDYQHADAATQLVLKKNILRETLERAGIAKLQPLPEIETHAAAEWEYRNRVRMHTTLAEGRMRLGYTRAHSNAVVPIAECPISAPLLLRAAKAVEQIAYEDRNAFEVLHACSEVEFFCDAVESQLQVTLIAMQEDASPLDLRGFLKLLREHLPELQSVAWRGAKAVTAMEYMLGDEMYIVPHGAFFQSNRKLLPEMLDCVTRGRSGDTAWDLYAGVGLFARVLAKHFGKLIAVESAPSAMDALRQNLHGVAAEVRVLGSDTLGFLRLVVARKMHAPDLIVVDPPRTGLGAEVCALLAAIAPREIVYVSCDPSTMARDLAALLGAGWHCDAMHLFDMFPQTSHIESVAMLRR